MVALTRRQFTRAVGFGTFAFLVSNERKFLTPAQAFEQRSAFEVLDGSEVGALESLAEAHTSSTISWPPPITMRC